MIAIAEKKRHKKPKRSRQPHWHNRFLDMLPTIRVYAGLAFQALPHHAREERISDVVANALVAFRRLVDRGRDALAYPTVLAKYGIAQVRAGRGVGNSLNSRDILSNYAQRRQGFHVERLDAMDSATSRWQEIAVEDRRTCPADIAALRIDLAAWLSSLPPHRQRIALKLAVGESTNRVAQLFGVSAARISQLRSEFYRAWQQFHGEDFPEAVPGQIGS